MMNALVLKTALKARWKADLALAIPGFSVISNDIDTFLDVLANGTAVTVVEHISTLAQVTGVQVSVASVSGVTTGAGASGPGTGTGTAPPGSIS